MSQETEPEPDMPAMQRLLEQPYTLLAIGMTVMLVFYTGWGALELYYLPQATLP